MPPRHWFEISDEGFSQLSTTRPLGRLLLEAVQNAFDERPTSVAVTLTADRIVIEDDSDHGLKDERLVYTLFLSDKRSDPTRRGRLGRGLKELLAAMDRAVVETAGTTVTFDADGRSSRPNTRERGTRIELQRDFSREELEATRAILRLCLPPTSTTLRVDGRTVRSPRSVLTLPSCELETVRIEDGVERATMRTCRVSLYTPRKGETPYLFEMGIPVAAWNVPWHVDVGQRIPLSEGRDAVPHRYTLALKAMLLEAAIHRYMETRDLRADWVHEVVSQCTLKTSVLDAYVSKVFQKGAVLGGTRRANDRASQLGAHVVDVATLSHGAYVALARVLETADDYVRRRSVEFEGDDVEPDETQLRFADAVRWLARRIAGRVIRVRFFTHDPTDDGLLADATMDVRTKVLSFNVRSLLRFDDILDPYTLGVVLHELAHLETPEHDRQFIDRLQFLSGHLARVLAEGGPALAERLRRGDPHPHAS